jgi:hypothetical protein
VVVSEANPTIPATCHKVGFACGSPPPYVRIHAEPRGMPYIPSSRGRNSEISGT